MAFMIKKYFWLTLFVIASIFAISSRHAALGQAISPLDQFTATTSPTNSITQRTYGKSIRITGLSDGCLGLTSGLVTSNGTPCGSGSGSGGTGFWTRLNNSGLYPATSTDQVLIGASATTSTAKLNVVGNADFSGTVGIGTTSPLGNLDVESLTGGGDIQIGVNQPGVSAFSRLLLTDRQNGNNNWQIRVNNASTLGTTYANLPLSAILLSNSATTNGTILGGTANAPFIFATGGISFANWRGAVSGTGIWTFGNSSTSPTETITSSGVGIGTSTPAQALSVVGRTYSTTGYQFGDGTVQTTAATSLANTIANGLTATTTFSNGGVVFSDSTKLTQDTANLFWDNTNKRLAIGTTTTGYKFESIGTTDGTTRTSFQTFPTASSGGLRSNFTGSLGFTFTLAANITVSSLGRLYISGDTHNHFMAIYDISSPGSAVVSGTVLAATASDANNYKYVSITPTTLLASKTYAIAIDEVNGQDQWLDQAWTSTNFLNPYVKRLGSNFGTASAYPSSFNPGNVIYGAPAFKFTTSADPQVVASYDTNNKLFMVSRSTGDATIFSSMNDQALAFQGPVAIGKSSATGGTVMDVQGVSQFTTLQIANATTLSQTFNILFSGSGAASSFGNMRMTGGFVVLNSGTNPLSLNFDNSSHAVDVGATLQDAAAFGVGINSATQKGQIILSASGQTADLEEWLNNAGAAMSVVNNLGYFGIGTSTPFTPLSVDIASSSAALPVATPTGFSLRFLFDGLVHFAFDIYGRVVHRGAVGTLTSCGTSATLDPGSNDEGGIIRVGTGIGLSSCTYTFKYPRSTSVLTICPVTQVNGALGTFEASTTPTGITITATSIANLVYSYQCSAYGN